MSDTFGLPEGPTAQQVQAAFEDEPEPQEPAEETPAPEPEPEPEPEPTSAEGVNPLTQPQEEPPADQEEPEQALDEAEEKEKPEGTPLPTEGAFDEPFLGKYQTVEQANAAYNELRRSERQAAEDNRVLTEYLRVAAQELQAQKQAAAAPQPQQVGPTQADFEAEAERLGVDADTLKLARQIAAQETQQQLLPIQTQMQQAEQQRQQQMEMAQQQAAIQATTQMIQAWKASVSDLDDATENTMVEIFEELNLDETEPAFYPAVLEIARDPALRSVVQGIPALTESDEGMAMARRLASVGTTDTQTPRAARNTPEARAAAQIERGPSGAVPAAKRSKDAWDEVLDITREDLGKTSPLGV